MSGNSTNGESKRIVPTKFAHAVLRTNKFRQMVDWYKTVLLARSRVRKSRCSPS